MTIPTSCISVRQPFPYFMFELPREHRCGVLNREWGPSEFRGWVWIRAGRKPTKKEFYAGLEFAEGAFVPGELMPALEKLSFQGVVGRARIVDVYQPGRQRDRWHDPRQFGYVLADAVSVPFVPSGGARTLFELEPAALEQLRGLW